MMTLRALRSSVHLQLFQQCVASYIDYKLEKSFDIRLFSRNDFNNPESINIGFSPSVHQEEILAKSPPINLFFLPTSSISLYIEDFETSSNISWNTAPFMSSLKMRTSGHYG